MPFYKVHFRWVSKSGQLKSEHVRVESPSKEAAKSRVIKAEKPKLIAVDRVVRLKS